MAKKTILMNLATRDTDYLCGYMTNETPHDDPNIVDLTMQPDVVPLSPKTWKKKTFRFLKEGEHFIKKNFDGQSVYVIFRDSEGNSAIAGSLMDELNKTLVSKNKEINELQGKINSLERILKEHDEDQETKDFKRDQLRRGSSNRDRSRYPEGADNQIDRDFNRGINADYILDR